jgi:WD40 repeat protein
LATGGSDGTVAVWDHRAKKRIKLYNRLPTAISALAFSGDGSRLAVGVSNMQDVTNNVRTEELKQKGDDPNHVSIVVKTVGEELKVCSTYPNSDPCGCKGVWVRPECLPFWPTFGFVTLYVAFIMSLPDLITISLTCYFISNVFSERALPESWPHSIVLFIHKSIENRAMPYASTSCLAPCGVGGLYVQL